MTKGIVICNLNQRKERPSVNAERPGYYVSGDEVEIVEVVPGTTELDFYEGTPSWYRLSNGLYVWSGGVSVDLDEEIFKKKLALDRSTSEKYESLEFHTDYLQGIIKVVEFGHLLKSFNYSDFLPYDNLKKVNVDAIAVGVLDKGVNKNHPSLKGAFMSNANDSLIAHGTAMSSIIGGINGISGFISGVSLFDLRFLNENGFPDDQLFSNSIDLFLSSSQNFKLINASINITSISKKMENLLIETAKKSIIFAAAGEYEKNELSINQSLQFPASSKEVISIGTFKSFNHENYQWNSSLNYLILDVPYAFAWEDTSYKYTSYGEDSCATAFVCSLAGKILGSQILKSVSKERIIKLLDQIADPINSTTNHIPFKLYKP